MKTNYLAIKKGDVVLYKHEGYGHNVIGQVSGFMTAYNVVKDEREKPEDKLCFNYDGARFYGDAQEPVDTIPEPLTETVEDEESEEGSD